MTNDHDHDQSPWSWQMAKIIIKTWPLTKIQLWCQGISHSRNLSFDPLFIRISTFYKIFLIFSVAPDSASGQSVLSYKLALSGRKKCQQKDKFHMTSSMILSTFQVVSPFECNHFYQPSPLFSEWMRVSLICFDCTTTTTSTNTSTSTSQPLHRFFNPRKHCLASDCAK